MKINRQLSGMAICLKVRDRSGLGIKFNSNVIPPYLKRTQNIEEFLQTLKHLLRRSALGLWEAVAQCWPDTDQQRCWVYKTAKSHAGQGSTA